MADDDQLDKPDPDALMFGAMEEAARWIDMAAGYRAKCKAAGFTDHAAEAMAVDFHHLSLEMALIQARPKPFWTK